MKLLALLTPAVMLAVLWTLQRLEVWMNDTSGPIRRPHQRAAARYASVPPANCRKVSRNG